jgi:hypothetical protein
MKTTEYNILSPDGIMISMQNYATKELAFSGFHTWKKRFEKQGYYSSFDGRVELEDLVHVCQLITMADGEPIEVEILYNVTI